MLSPIRSTLHAELIQQREVEVRQRSVVESDMPAAFQVSGAASRQDHRDVDRRVAVAIGHPGAVHHGHVVQQRAVAIGGVACSFASSRANICT